MTTSEQINEIAGALAKAQLEMDGAKKDAANPFFKSKYADLASVRDACMAAMNKQGISVMQSPSADGAKVSVVTLLAHSSGQWVRGEASCTAKDDSPQSVGSATTYLRRYALQSFAGVAPEDDDAEAAQGRGSKSAQVQVTPVPSGYDDWVLSLEATVVKGIKSLESAWKASKPEYRQYLMATTPKALDRMKADASRAGDLVSA
jgi:hypothetical protein